MAALAFYCVLSFAFFGRSTIGHFTAWFIGEGHDPSLYIWSMVWWPYALSHRLNPFLTRMVWHPNGFNLAWVTTVPLASLVSAPVTATLGPIASFNLLCLFFPALSPWTAFVLCRHVTWRLWPSLFGGYLFGFSPYMLNHEMLGQLTLLGVFPIALALLAVVLRLDGKLQSSVFIAVLAMLLVCHFLLSPELFTSLTVTGALALIIAFLLDRNGSGSRIYSLMPSIGLAYAVVAAVLSPYLYHMLAFGVPHSAIMSPKVFSADLLNFLVPTSTNAAGDNWLMNRMSRPFGAPQAEATAYVALPMVGIAVMYGREYWQQPLCKLLLIFAAICALVVLGPRLRIAGWRGPVLPWKLVTSLPLLKNILPVRLCLYLSLDMAIIGAVAVWLASGSQHPVTKSAFAISTILLTLPNLSFRVWYTTKAEPVFFSQLYQRYLNPNEVVVTIPFGYRGDSMIWQAQSHMCFRMAGGHTGSVLIDSYQQWPAVNALFFRTALPNASEQFKPFLATHGVGAIIVDDREPGWWKPIVATLAVNPIQVGGVLLYQIPAAELAPYRNANPADYESRFARDRFDALIVAANRYWSQYGTTDSLTPLRAQQLGVLPGNWVVNNGLNKSTWRTGSGSDHGAAPTKSPLEWTARTTLCGRSSRRTVVTPRGYIFLFQSRCKERQPATRSCASL